VSIRYDILPKHLRAGMQLYIEQGIPPGSFLTAVICDRLVEAFNRADEWSAAGLRDVALFMYDQAPEPCWGSEAKMDAWIQNRGQEGA